jgi:hypothetical protein
MICNEIEYEDTKAQLVSNTRAIRASIQSTIQVLKQVNLHENYDDYQNILRSFKELASRDLKKMAYEREKANVGREYKYGAA